MARKRSRFCNRDNMRILIQALEQRTYLSFGAVDSSSNNLIPNYGTFYRAALQSDGKIIETRAVGQDFYLNFQIARLNPDGSVDSSFGSNGQVTTDLGHSDSPEGIVVQPNGKIDVVGTSISWNVQIGYAIGTASWMAIAQYNPDGSLDTTFGNGGTLLLSGDGHCIAMDGDKLLIGGSLNSGTFIIRVNSDGTTDTTFASSGLTGLQFPFGVYSLAIDAQGRILAAGQSGNVARLNGDGTLDTSFGNGGIATLPGSANYISSIAALPDGSVLAASIVNSGEADVLRLTQNGRFDTTFGVGGIANTNANGAESLTLLPDGQILVAAPDAGGAAEAVVRLNADGSLDDTFGYDGYFSGGYGLLGAVVLLPDGSYLLVGERTYRINPLLPSPAPTTMVGNAGGPYTVAEQQSIKLAASETGDLAGSYEWDFNYDGVTFNPQGSGPSPSYSAGQLDGPSTHEIAVRIRNEWGSPVIATSTMNIVNGPPTATLSPVKSWAYVGSPAAVQFTNQLDSTVDMAQGFHYSYDFNNDGVFEVTNSGSPTQLIPPSYLSAAGKVTIHGRITDDEGASSDYTTTVDMIVPPLATVSGALFQDTNENGVQNINELPLAGWKVYIDSNHNGIFDAGESTGTTDSYGYYSISVLPGTYDVRVSPQAGYQPVEPASGGQTTTFASGSQSIGVNFGFDQSALGSIAGNVFNDLNGNGILENGEAGIAGAQVYLDANNNGALDSNEVVTTADTYGNYFFGGLDPGTYTVRAIAASGWQQISPANNAAQIVSVPAGQSVLGINFGQAQPNASITGTFFYDTNGNGVWDSGEAISPLWGVYLDMNNDGIRQSSEPEVIANSSGVFTFTGLLPGIYHVRPTTAAKWTQTAPAGGAQIVNAISGQTVSNVNIGEVRGAATVTSSDIAEFLGNAFTLKLAYSGFHPLIDWTINWGDGSAVESVDPSVSSWSHTYSTISNFSPYTIHAWANSSDGSAPANPVNVMIYTAPTLSGGVLSLRGTTLDDTATFSNASGIFTVNLDGAKQQYNSTLVTSATFNGLGGNDTISNSSGENLTLDSFGGKMVLNAISGTITLPNVQFGIYRFVSFSSINISAGAKVVMSSPAPVGNVISNSPRYIAEVDPGGLNIAPGGILDMGVNDLIVKYVPGQRSAADALVSNLLDSGYDGGRFDAAGIDSSAVSYDASSGSGTRALGWADNQDLGKSYFDGIDVSDLNEVMVKFTYYGDCNLDGIVDTGPDLSLFAKGFHGQGSGWAFGDFNYDGVTNNLDVSLFSRGMNSGYKKFGAL